MSALVEVDGAATGYGGGIVLHGLSFAVERGQRVGVLGPNGGGKTTLFRLLLGELPVRAGTRRVGGRVATVPQTERSRLDYPVSALDVVLMGTLAARPWWRPPTRADRATARAALERVGLSDRAAATFGELSGGQRQRVLVARALVQHGEVLLLDEPLTGVDARSAVRLLDLIDELAAEGRAILISTHDVDQTRRWDRVLCLNGHQVAYGPPDATLTRDVLQGTYGHQLITVHLEDGTELAVMPADHHHGHAH